MCMCVCVVVVVVVVCICIRSLCVCVYVATAHYLVPILLLLARDYGSSQGFRFSGLA